MKLREFDYYLPRELIAQRPLVSRDSSRLLVLHKKEGKMEHRSFQEIVRFLQKGDVVVVNNTRVIPARLVGRKKETGGKAEIFLLRKKEKDTWECLLKPAKKIQENSQIHFTGTDLIAQIVKKGGEARGIVRFSASGDVEKAVEEVGRIPLPPYIKRNQGPTSQDEDRYQTIYAKEKGAVAAPTAGLHFTPSLVERITEKGAQIVEITLHTGWASFKSLNKERVEDNEIPKEYFKISEKTARAVNQAKRKEAKVVAIGTTTTRALETQAEPSGMIGRGEGWTSLFIYPGYEFRVVDALITNFHIPRSSLILLVSAFAGREKILGAYQEAIRQGYRFLSYGDAMLII